MEEGGFLCGGLTGGGLPYRGSTLLWRAAWETVPSVLGYSDTGYHQEVWVPLETRTCPNSASCRATSMFFGVD